MLEDYRFCPRCASPLVLRTVEEREVPVCPACGYIHYLDPKVVACTIPAIDGRVLLLRRAINPGRGRWVFPGGYVNRGETVAAAAGRETLEEISLTVAITDLVGIYSYLGSPVVIIVYRVEIFAGTPRVNSESSEVRAFSQAEVPWDELAFPSTREALQDWFAGRRRVAGADGPVSA